MLNKKELKIRSNKFLNIFNIGLINLLLESLSFNPSNKYYPAHVDRRKHKAVGSVRCALGVGRIARYREREV